MKNNRKRSEKSERKEKETPKCEKSNWRIMEELKKHSPILISSMKAAVTLNIQNKTIWHAYLHIQVFES